MRRPAIWIGYLVLSGIVVFTASCGGNMAMQNQRFVQSVTVSPATADAAKFPSGQVQFTATGNFNMAPMTETIPVQWSIGMPGSTQPVPAGVTIDSMSGMAQCSGFSGTVTIAADFTMNPDRAGTAAQVFGTAQLTCP
jgi:hypothetical protein